MAVMNSLKKIDLHVHSKYSDTSQDSLLKTFKAAESYVEPETVYKIARLRGMDYVTITDHDTIRGCLEIKMKYPDSVIMGVESTAYFPEDQTPVHILFYGFTENQFSVIQSLRSNIYVLREYIMNEKIAHSVAHPLYMVDKNFTVEHFEKLILLFNTFESINGCCSGKVNKCLTEIIRALDEQHMMALAYKHGIKLQEGISRVKGFTAGSDDHSSLFIGKAYSEIEAPSVDDIPRRIMERCSIPCGTEQNFREHAFYFYYGFHNHIKAMKNSGGSDFLSSVTETFFSGKSLSLKNRINMWMLRSKSRKGYNALKEIAGMTPDISIEQRIEKAYEHIESISDDLITGSVMKTASLQNGGSFVAAIRSISSFTTAALMYLPFLASFLYQHKNDHLLEEARNRFMPGNILERKRILWFTDTINDLNGVSITLKNIGWRSYKQGEDLKLVSSLLPEEMTVDLPPNYDNLKPLCCFTLPFYEKLNVRIPSLLSMLDRLQAYDPHEVYISSPSVIGLFGLIYARVFNKKCTVVYHTDFTMQATNIIGEDSFLISLIEKYTKWFHECADRILVPSTEYIEILKRRGFDENKLGLFIRGIDAEYFMPREDEGRKYLHEKLGLIKGINLMYAGRISEDKNIDFLIEAYTSLTGRTGDVNLIFAGDGPYLETIMERCKSNPAIYFMGNVHNSMLPLVYSGSDILVFPSKTDTFGMVILEAQSCGLPVIVSDIGGPRCVIEDGKTGFILETDHPDTWMEKIYELIGWIRTRDKRYVTMKENAREHVLRNFNSSSILDNYFKHGN